MFKLMIPGVVALACFTGSAAFAKGSPPPVDPTTPLPSNFSSAATIYSDRASFNAAAGALTTDDFEFTPTNTTVPSQGFASGSYTAPSGTVYALSTLPPAGYNGPVDLNLLDSTYLPSTGSYIGTHYGSDVLTSGYDKVTFTFDHAVTSFGLDFGTYAIAFGNKADILSFAVAGLGTQTEYSTAGAPTFFGFTSTTAFNSITIDTTSSTQRVYDNVSITSAPSSAVPEPASWALMVGGFGAMGAAMRRRRPNITFA